MKRDSSPFKWRHYAPDVIFLYVRRYCRHALSYRDLEEMLKERGLCVNHGNKKAGVNVLRLRSE